MITYPLSMPSTPGIRNVTFGANSMVSAAVSPFTGSQQTTSWPGEWWEAEVALPPMALSQAAAWTAFLAACRGMEATFLLGDPSRTLPLGVAGDGFGDIGFGDEPWPGAIVVNGNQNGQSRTLATRGWNPSTPKMLRAGDYIQVGSGVTQRLYMVVTDTDTDASGDATLDIFPCIRGEGVTDGEAIVLSNCQGTFRLASNWRPWQVKPGLIWTASFSAIEAL